MHWRSFIAAAVDEFNSDSLVTVLKFKVHGTKSSDRSRSDRSRSDRSRSDRSRSDRSSDGSLSSEANKDDDEEKEEEEEEEEEDILDDNVVVAFDEQLLSLAIGNALSNCMIHGNSSSNNQIIIEGHYNRDTQRLNVIIENSVDSIHFKLSQHELTSLKMKSDTRTDIFSSAPSNETVRGYVKLMFFQLKNKLMKYCHQIMKRIRSSSSSSSSSSTVSKHALGSSSKSNISFSSSAPVVDMADHTFQSGGTGCGFRHISLAVRTAGGSYRVKYDEKKSKFLIQLSFPAKLLSGPTTTRRSDVSSSSSSSSSSSIVPPQRLIGSNGLVIGSSCGEDIPTQLKVCAIDDSRLICKGYSKMVLPQLKANLHKSYICCPAVRADIKHFVDTVLGKGGEGEENDGGGQEEGEGEENDDGDNDGRGGGRGGGGGGGGGDKSNGALLLNNRRRFLTEADNEAVYLDRSEPADICILDQNIEIKSNQVSLLCV
jgi:hypothetical protein